MTAITLLLLAAATGLALSRATGLPSIPMLLVAGALLSRLAPLPEGLLQDALLLGLTVMVFVAGIELSPQRVGAQTTAALKVGIAQFLLMGAVGFGAALAFGYSLVTSAYLALAMTASSTLVVVGLLQERRQLFEPFGRMVTGVLLLQDLLIILSIPVITRLSEGPAAVTAGVLATLGVVALAEAVVRWLGPFVLTRFGEDEEVLLLLVLAVLFAFLGLANLLRLPLVSGAFLAGVSLSGFPVRGLVRGQLASLSDFFSALFFTALGGFLPIPAWAELVQGAGFILVVILITPPLVAFVAERAGLSARPALAAGLLLSQTSELSLVIGLQGMVFGQISEAVFGIIALVTLVTMMLTPFLATDRVTWTLVHRHPFRARRALPEPPHGHVLLVGGGRNGVALLEVLVVSPNRVVVLDDDPALVHWLEESRIPAIRGDASDSGTLRAAGADRARIIVSTIRRTKDNGPLLEMVRSAPVLVRAFNIEDARWIEARGGWPILYSEAAAEDFLEWYQGWELTAPVR